MKRVPIEIYSTSTCPHCVRAKKLLEGKGIPFVEFNLTEQPFRRAEFTVRTRGAKTVPQIFIHDELVGGADDLVRLNASGELDRLLKE